MKKLVALCTVVVLWLTPSVPAVADWDPGDAYKMHYPQLPDPNGFDVSLPFDLADDWLCTETGPVEAIHFWYSWENEEVSEDFTLTVRIYSDDSGPDEVLWQLNLQASEVTTRLYGSGDQGWYPPGGPPELHDHNDFYQLNITDIEDPLIQLEGEIYWLSISTLFPPPSMGWKTTFHESQYNEFAMSRTAGPHGWEPIDPTHLFVRDLAFVITPEPATIVLLAFGSLALLRRRKINRRER